MGCEIVKYKNELKVLCFLTTLYHGMMHFHNDIEIIYMVEGSVFIKTKGEMILLRKNDIFMLEKNIPHDFENTEEKNAALIIQFNPSFSAGFYPRLSRLRFVKNLLTPADGWIYEEMRRSLLSVAKSFRSKKEGFSFAITRIVCDICIRIVEDMKTIELTDEVLSREERNIARLTRIMEHVNEGYMNRITLKAISQAEGLNMCYLSHFIKENLGMSFQQYLNKVRIKNAERMIAAADKSNLDICIACGFSDYRYLQKAFVAEYGCTPAQYRKECRYGEAESINEPMEGYPNGVVYIDKVPDSVLGFLET
jgi:AraC-like DNA-binding protein